MSLSVRLIFRGNVAVRNVKHAFGEGVCPLHVVEISAGRAETGFAGKWNPAELIAVITGIISIRIEAFFSPFDKNDKND